MAYYWPCIYLLPTHPPIYLVNYLSTITYLLPTHSPNYYFLTYVPTYLPIPFHQPTYVPTYIFSSSYNLLTYLLLSANLTCH
jgi:hypothetical protein